MIRSRISWPRRRYKDTIHPTPTMTLQRWLVVLTLTNLALPVFNVRAGSDEEGRPSGGRHRGM
jgi:hypothetical protein